MGMRTVNDPYGDPSVLVDTVFGTSYDAVRDVANNIDYVKKVANLFDTSDTVVANLHQRYISVGGQNEFELPVTVVSEAFVTVFVNGKWKSPSVTYTSYDTTLFFNQALAQGDVVDVMIVSGETFDVLQKLKEDTEQFKNEAQSHATTVAEATTAATTAAAAALEAQGLAETAAGQLTGLAVGKPIVIVSDGQSNSANVRSPYAWTPSQNLYVWNSSGIATGTAFISMYNDRMNYAFAFADEIAKANPASRVYLIQSGRPGLEIANWLPGAPSQDAYALTKSRVEAALTTIGEDEIDIHLWWQGENDSDTAKRAVYVSQFDAYIDRIEGEAWYPENTPVRVAGVVSAAINGDGKYSQMNMILQRVCWGHAERSFYYTPQALEPSDWLDALHPTGGGYEKAGRANAKALMRGGSPVHDGQMVNLETGNYGFGADSGAGQQWDFRVDRDADTQMRLVNLGPGDNASATVSLLNGNGVANFKAWGDLAPGRFEINWTGTAGLQIRAHNATAGINFYAGESSETLRLTPNSLHLRGTDPAIYIDGKQVLKRTVTGWGTPSGIATRSSFATGTVTTEQLAERVKALIDDLKFHGVIGV